MHPRYQALARAFVIRDDNPQWLIDFPFLEDKFDMLSGKRYSHNWNPLIYAFSWDSDDGVVIEHPDYPAVLGEHFNACSERMADIIMSFDAGAVEFLPFRTRTSVGEDVTNHYRLMNCLKWISAIDKKKSRLSDEKAGYCLQEREYILDKVVLDPKHFDGPIFRINGWPHCWVIREDLVQAFDDAGISGLTLEELPLD